ncbi:hypothetical protein I4F81_011494 [Pyropia yezoensis]|uniref:Uncharacterized protein n=1 Tax=Pyropia yezoensis TaxID=2788 RepID=A0ACC3CFQ6_PYRYE|nr:hypothetical protein I4F81_011494 [Neopyropia yezoensis]
MHDLAAVVEVGAAVVKGPSRQLAVINAATSTAAPSPAYRASPSAAASARVKPFSSSPPPRTATASSPPSAGRDSTPPHRQGPPRPDSWTRRHCCRGRQRHSWNPRRRPRRAAGGACSTAHSPSAASQHHCDEDRPRPLPWLHLPPAPPFHRAAFSLMHGRGHPPVRGTHAREATHAGGTRKSG